MHSTESTFFSFFRDCYFRILCVNFRPIANNCAQTPNALHNFCEVCDRRLQICSHCWMNLAYFYVSDVVIAHVLFLLLLLLLMMLKPKMMHWCWESNVCFALFYVMLLTIEYSQICCTCNSYRFMEISFMHLYVSFSLLSSYLCTCTFI